MRVDQDKNLDKDVFALFLGAFIVDFEYSLFIVNAIKCYLMAYLCGTPNRRYIYGSCKTLVCNCANDQPYRVFISCYNDLIYNFYYSIAVPTGKTCSMALMRFNKLIFYILFYFIAPVLICIIETIF